MMTGVSFIWWIAAAMAGDEVKEELGHMGFPLS